MFHFIWYIIVGLIAGVIAKMIMHIHMALVPTILVGIAGSLVGGFVTHIFSPPKEGAPFHPAGIIVSIIGAVVVLFIWSHFGTH